MTPDLAFSFFILISEACRTYHEEGFCRLVFSARQSDAQ
jgi:hypothetical protein